MAKTVHFVDHFWGEKNEGFSVLYANAKCGLTATKELGEFLGQSAKVQEDEAKAHLKILKQFNLSNGQCGSFSPVLLSLKMSTEQLASVHHTWMLNLQELMKQVQRYNDDLQKGVKKMKEEETPTMEAVKSLHDVNNALQRSRDLYRQRASELDKVRRETNNNSNVEKAESKMRKALDDYKSLVDRHAQCRDEFESRMTDSAQRLETQERKHLEQLRTFVNTYTQAARQNSKEWIKVQEDLEARLNELTPDNLIEQFTLAKSTGVERPIAVSLDDERASLSTLDRSNSDRGSLEGSVKDGLNRKGSSNSTPQQSTGSVGVVASTPPPLPPPRPPSISTTDRASTSQIASPSQSVEDQNSVISSNSVASNVCSTTINNSDNIATVSTTNTTRSAWPGFLRRRNRKKKGTKASDDDAESHSEIDDSIVGRSKTPTTPEVSNNDLLLIDTSIPPKGSSTFQQSSSSEPPTGSGSAVDKDPWDDFNRPQNNFDSSSDDSDEDDDTTKKLKVEIKPVSNGGDAINSASVDELRSAIVGLDLGVPISKSRPQSALNERINTNSTPIDKNCENPAMSSAADNTSIRRAQSQSQLSVLRSAGNKGANSSNDLLMGLALHSINIDEAKTSSALKSEDPTTVYENSSETQLSSKLDKDEINSYHNVSGTSNATNKEVEEIMSDCFTSDQPRLPPKQNATSSGKRASSVQRDLISSSLIALPRPPSRHSAVSNTRHRASPLSVLEPKLSVAKEANPSQINEESTGSNNMPKTKNMKRLSSYTSSRGPSPLALGLTDCIPLAVAFQEICHASFKDADESKCQVRLLGDMMISFPAGIVQLLASNPNPQPLVFRVVKAAVLEAVVPNKQLISQSKPLSTNESLVFEFNMDALRELLKKQAEQNPSASYFNIDILKYQIRRGLGASSCPLHLVSYWKCNAEHTDLRLDYKYNGHSMAKTMPLLNVSVSVPVNGGVNSINTKPNATWMADIGRALWRVPSLSSENGVGSLRGRFQLSNGPGSQATIAVQFNCEGTSLSGIDFELMGTGYRLSLVKKRFVSGKYICDGDASGEGTAGRYAAPPSSSPVNL